MQTPYPSFVPYDQLFRPHGDFSIRGRNDHSSRFTPVVVWDGMRRPVLYSTGREPRYRCCLRISFAVVRFFKMDDSTLLRYQELLGTVLRRARYDAIQCSTAFSRGMYGKEEVSGWVARLRGNFPSNLPGSRTRNRPTTSIDVPPSRRRMNRVDIRISFPSCSTVKVYSIMLMSNR